MENKPTFEIVARPTETQSSNEFINAFVLTAETGEAIRLPLEGTNYRRITARLQSLTKSRNIQQHIRKDGPDHVIVWATKIPTVVV